MRITDKFKRACLKARVEGHKAVYSHAAQSFYTIYVTVWDINHLMGLPNGTLLSAYNGGPYRLYNTYNWAVKRYGLSLIQYSYLMRKYS